MLRNKSTLTAMELEKVTGGSSDSLKSILMNRAMVRAICDVCGNVTMVKSGSGMARTVIARCETCGHSTRMTIVR